MENIMKPSNGFKNLNRGNRSMTEILDDMQKTIIRHNGRLYTEEEAIVLTDEIRRELREKGELR